MNRYLCVMMVLGLGVSCLPDMIDNHLPRPESVCRVTLNWRGILPGLSTRQDVINVLGNPTSTGNRKFGDQQLSFYTYVVEGGKVSNFVRDNIFFGQDGIVDWIEAVVADRDGRFHPAQEVISELGSTIDTAYTNSTYDPSRSFQYDVVSGPDELYVWSECGLALDIHGACFPSQEGSLRCISPEDRLKPGKGIATSVTLRNPYPTPFDTNIALGSENAILMKILFRPTTYQGFLDYYRSKIPFLIWEDYLHKVDLQR